MAKKQYQIALVQDKTGMYWDLALYVPTVIFLVSIALKMWYTADKSWAYLLMFMATFFLMAGSNRILKSRMMLTGSSPISIDADKQRISCGLRSGEKVELVKTVRYFPDFAGKSFAITGLDLSGKKCQYVFHRGQFSDVNEYKELREFLRIYG